MKKALVIDKKNIIEIIEVDNSKIIGYTLIEVNNQSKISNTYSGVVKKITKNGFCFIDIGLDDMCFIDLNKSKNSLKHGDKLNVIVIKDKTLVKKMQVKQTEIIHNNTSEIEKKIQELEKNLYEIIRGDETLVTDNFITKELDNIYAKKIWLKCGGYILIEECETATLIDVNSGKNIKSKTTEELAIKTNQEACEIITKQLKLRNIAGIIFN